MRRKVIPLLRFAEGTPISLYPSIIRKVHAVPLDSIQNKHLGSRNSSMRPARCGCRVVVGTVLIGGKKFLKEFNEDNPHACGHCLKLIEVDRRKNGY